MKNGLKWPISEARHTLNKQQYSRPQFVSITLGLHFHCLPLVFWLSEPERIWISLRTETNAFLWGKGKTTSAEQQAKIVASRHHAAPYHWNLEHTQHAAVVQRTAPVMNYNISLNVNVKYTFLVGSVLVLAAQVFRCCYAVVLYTFTW